MKKFLTKYGVVIFAIPLAAGAIIALVLTA